MERSIKFCDNLQGQKNYLISNIEAYNKKIAEYSKGIRDMYMDKVKGLISESDFTEMSRDFSIERDRLKCVVSDEEKKLNDLTEKIKMDKSNHSLAEKYTNLERLDREMIEILIDYIIIYKRIPGTRNVPIEIHWNF